MRPGRGWNLRPIRHKPAPPAGFTLTELLVVIAVLALLAATQLPALTGAKSPSRLAQCLNNCRRIAQATALYRADHNDTYPHVPRTTTPQYLGDTAGWPRKLLVYMDGYTTNVQPAVYVCPNETNLVLAAPFQLHYQANRNLFCDTVDCPVGIRGSQVRKPAAYWMQMEKAASWYAEARTGGLVFDYLLSWNTPNSLGFGMRRHNGGLTAAAADGHVEWLRMPAYKPGTPAPLDFVELGDCFTPPNSQAYAPYWAANGPRAKLFCRDTVGGPL